MLLFFTILLCLFLIFIYFAPSFIAISRKHSYVLQITLLNALLGWSFFGWAAALIWATTNHINENASAKLSWVIISVFAAAILFPVIFFWEIFGFYVPGNIEIKNPSNVEKIEYRGCFYKLKPDTAIKENENNKKVEPEDKD